MLKMDYEKIIWENEKLEIALDKILFKYYDKIFDKRLMQELASLPEPERSKKIEETGAFGFCLCDPMRWAKEYCEDVVSAIYDEDDEFDEDELVENLIIYCQENMMQDMYEEANIDYETIIKAIA
jgi:hypothetical protein